MNLFVAIPAYDSTISVQTAGSLLNEQAVFSSEGHEILISFLPACSLITVARNQLIADFLKSDCDKVAFVDADVSWEQGDLLRLASHGYDVVGGAYRFKEPIEGYPVQWPTPELTPEREQAARDGLMEVEGLPGGFLCLSREALEQFRAFHGDRSYEHQGHEAYAYFTAPFRDGRLYGEDAAFCADYRATGGRVWLDPSLTLSHHSGPHAYTGRVGDWLRSRLPQKEAA